MNISLPYNWSPRVYQVPLWNFLVTGGKRAAVSWPRRHGKDDVLLHFNALSAFKRIGNYWYMLPKYDQCRKAVWDAINPHTGKKRIDEAFPVEIRKKTLTQEMKIEFHNGSTWQLMGSDNYDTLVGSPPIGLSYSEYAISNPNSWGYLRPILLENGGWSVFNSTPRGKNHFYKMIQMAKGDKSWFSQVLTNNETKLFTNEQLLSELKELQAEHGETFGKALWLQEYFCSFEAAVPGSIWGEQIAKIEQAGHIREVPLEDDYPVHTAWDLGRDDFTCVWFFQIVADEIRILNYYQCQFKEIPDICDDIKKIAETEGYTYGTHWMPHDAFPIRLGMGGKSMMQQFMDEKIGRIGKVPSLGKDSGIRAGGVTLNRSYFDLKCLEALEMLKGYHRKYDEIKKKFSDEPVHDENSHPADAWRYLSLTWKIARAQEPEISQLTRFHKGNVVNATFGQMKEAHFRKMRQARDA